MTTETSGDPRVAAGSAADWWEAGFEMGRLDQQLAARLLPLKLASNGGCDLGVRRGQGG